MIITYELLQVMQTHARHNVGRVVMRSHLIVVVFSNAAHATPTVNFQAMQITEVRGGRFFIRKKKLLRPFNGTTSVLEAVTHLPVIHIKLFRLTMLNSARFIARGLMSGAMLLLLATADANFTRNVE
jgi:hypothetical protein